MRDYKEMLDSIIEILRKYRYDNNKISDPNKFPLIADEIINTLREYRGLKNKEQL